VRDKGALVAEHSMAIGPEPENDPVFELGRRKLHEAKDSPQDAFEALLFDVVMEQRWRVAGGTRIFECEVAGMFRGEIVEHGPRRTSSRRGAAWHAQILKSF
jgi:hypothetical protein